MFVSCAGNKLWRRAISQTSDPIMQSSGVYEDFFDPGKRTDLMIGVPIAQVTSPGP